MPPFFVRVCMRCTSKLQIELNVLHIIHFPSGIFSINSPTRMWPNPGHSVNSFHHWRNPISKLTILSISDSVFLFAKFDKGREAVRCTGIPSRLDGRETATKYGLRYDSIHFGRRKTRQFVTVIGLFPFFCCHHFAQNMAKAIGVSS